MIILASIVSEISCTQYCLTFWKRANLYNYKLTKTTTTTTKNTTVNPNFEDFGIHPSSFITNNKKVQRMNERKDEQTKTNMFLHHCVAVAGA